MWCFQRPDTVSFADGWKYDLSKLSEREGDEILSVLASSAGNAAVSAGFESVKIGG